MWRCQSDLDKTFCPAMWNFGFTRSDEPSCRCSLPQDCARTNGQQVLEYILLQGKGERLGTHSCGWSVGALLACGCADFVSPEIMRGFLLP